MSANLFDLSDKVILITGATGALAGETAHYLLKENAKVIYLSRSLEKIEASVDAVKGDFPKAEGYACDVTNRASIEQACEQVVAKHGRIDGLVNGAGGNMPGATISPDKTVFDLDLEDYEKVMKLNLQGTILPSLVFGKVMVDQGRGSIVNFSSMAAQQTLTRVLGYSNAKAAVDNLTRWMATDFAKKHGDKIRVNAVAPGFFIGKQNKALLLNEDGSLTERGQAIISKTPMGRFGEASEVCGAVHYLLSDAAQFVTGQIIAMDGGFSAYSGV